MRSSRDWQLWLAHLAIFGRSIGAALLRPRLGLSRPAAAPSPAGRDA